MDEENKTPCECPLAGYCSRHKINKNLHYHRLCQNHSGYFNMWEEGRGPGQDGTRRPTEETSKEPKVHVCKFCHNKGCTGQCRNNNELPTNAQMAKNLISATKDHVKSGLKTVSEDEIKQRLEICGDCEHYIPHSARCKLCGCFTKFKAKLKSGGCPINKW